MTKHRPTRGDWLARLYEQLRERGHASLTAFAETRPTLPLVELAEELGAEFSAVQVFTILVDEADRNNQLTRLVRGQFVRELAESFPQGWPAVMDDNARLEVAMVLGSWFGFTPVTHQQRVDQASQALLTTPPPPGWSPLGPDDARLLALLPDEDV